MHVKFSSKMLSEQEEKRTPFISATDNKRLGEIAKELNEIAERMERGYKNPYGDGV